MGTGNGDWPTCIYDTTLCTGCSCKPSPLDNFYEADLEEEA